MKKQDIFADDVEETLPAKEETSPTVASEETDVVDSTVGNIIDLPSQGKLGYPSSVTYRDILVKDEEALSQATNETYTRTLNKVIKSLLNDCEFYDDLSVYDRDFILVYLWANNYSPTKDVEITCQNKSCGKTSKHTVDFTKLDVSDINPKFKGYYEFTSKSGNQIKVRLNTTKDEVLVEDYISKNKNNRYDNLMMAASVDLGVTMPFSSKVKWVQDNLTGAEMAKIKKFHESLRFGINPVIEYTCPHCGEVHKDMFPFQAEDILFPTVSADIEEFL